MHAACAHSDVSEVSSRVYKHTHSIWSGDYTYMQHALTAMSTGGTERDPDVPTVCLNVVAQYKPTTYVS